MKAAQHPTPMNKTESRYADALLARRAAGEVVRFWFEGMKLRIGPNTFYTVDFVVQMADDTVECHEVKAAWTKGRHAGKPGFREDARVKVKVAAQLFPIYLFRVATLHADGRWAFERIKPHV